MPPSFTRMSASLCSLFSVPVPLFLAPRVRAADALQEPSDQGLQGLGRHPCGVGQGLGRAAHRAV